MWRVRQVLSLLTAYFLWTAVFSHSGEIFGYSKSSMITYVLVAGFLQSVVLASRSIDLAGVINSGDLSNILTKPISNFWYWAARDISDKVLNALFSIGELLLLYVLLKPTLTIPQNNLILTLPVVLVLSTSLYYLINYLFGLLGFWTPEVWAPRFLLFVILQFVAGSLFPLDVLPKSFQQIVSLTPFPYLIYFPTQVFLGRISGALVFQGVAIASLWTVALAAATSWIWSKGLKAYGAEGR